MKKIKVYTKTKKISIILILIIIIIASIIIGIIVSNRTSNKKDYSLDANHVKSGVNLYLSKNKTWYLENTNIKNIGVHFIIEENSITYAKAWSITLNAIYNGNTTINNLTYKNVNLVLSWKNQIIDSQITDEIKRSGYSKINKHPVPNSGKTKINILNSKTNIKYFDIDLLQIQIPNMNLDLSEVNINSISDNSFLNVREHTRLFNYGVRTNPFGGKLPLNIVEKNAANPGNKSANFLLKISFDSQNKKLIIDLSSMYNANYKPQIINGTLTLNWTR